MLYICFNNARNRILCFVAFSPTGAVCRALHRRVVRHSRLGPAAAMLAGLVRRVPLHSARTVKDPLHLSWVSPDLFRLRGLAREPGDNRSWLPA